MVGGVLYANHFNVLWHYHIHVLGERRPASHASLSCRYGDSKAEVDFEDEIISGSLPPKQASIVKAWALIHQDELRANWDLAMNDEKLYKIEPLK